ncbi:MAG: adenosyl-hopene transferase HpnH [Dehalococcoidia bacterium]
MGRPAELGIRLFLYILKNRLKGRKRFPLVTMLEPLEMCNLSCVGCGRIREYKPVLSHMMPLEQALRAVEESGSPIVSIAGGEPTVHPQIDQIINELVRRKYFVYCCTNALLMERVMKKVPPSKYLCWVVHMDGMEEKHDWSVARKGVFKVAVHAIQSALDKGYRVCANTTIFNGCDAEDLQQMFHMLTDMGIEGCMVSAGYDFQTVEDRDLFLSRRQSIEAFKKILDPQKTKGVRFYNNPLYLEFLRGKRDYQCTAWSNPTYTVLGWRKPCYPLAAEGHTENVNELFEGSLWDRYGVGKDPRCANCMMHCGFESATIFQALSRPRDMVTLVKAGVLQKSGIGTG